MEYKEGEAIPFIELEEDLEYNKTNFTIHPDAIEALQNLKEKKIAVVVIAGPARSGKSFLANRFLNKMKGFKIGSTINACTKGIWMWSKPLPYNDEYNILLLDTEGINSVDRDKTIDTKLFTLSLLLSSMFIYNSIGLIDELALENLSLVTELTKNIAIKSASQNNNNDDRDLIQFFPYFFWVLRDFSLDLNGKTANDYLEKSLELVSGNVPESKTKNLIREKIKNYFRHRDCHTLIRPLTNENLLRNIEDQSYESLKESFRFGVENLMDRIYQRLTPKIINNKSLTGTLLLNLAFEYTQAINDGGIPEILTSLERIMSAEIRKTADEVLREYHEKFSEKCEEDMPLEEYDIRNRYRNITMELLTKFDKITKDIGETIEILDLRNEIVEKMEKDLDEKLQLNDERSQDLSKKLINAIFNQFCLPTILNIDDIKESVIKEFKADFINFYQNYKNFAHGPHKYDFLADCMPNFLFDYFENYIEKIKKVFGDEIAETKVYLEQARNGEEILRLRLQDQDALVYEYQKEKDTYRWELEKIVRENTNEIRKRNNEEQYLKDKIQDLEISLERKKRKIKDLKKGKIDMDQNIEKLKNEIANSQKENLTLQNKCRELNNQLLISQSKILENTENTPELTLFVDNIRILTNRLKEIFDDQKELGDISNNEEKLLEKQREIAQIEEFYTLESKRLRQDCKTEIQKIKDNFAQERNGLNQTITIFQNENNKLKAQIIDHVKCGMLIHEKEMEIEALNEKNRRLSDLVNCCNNKYETNLKVLESFKTQIEKKTNIIDELEMTIGKLKSQISSLTSKRYSLLHAVKEAIKKVGKKKHQLNEALKDLDAEEVNEIRNALQEINITIKY